MPEFLDLIEEIRGEDASIARTFGDEGTGVRSNGRTANPRYQQRFTEAAKFLAEVVRGRRPMYHLQEAMTTSDFPLYMADIVDRGILGNYRAWEKAWPQYLGRRTVSNFKNANLYTMDGAEASLTEVIPEMTEYPAASLAETRYQFSVKKYGRRLPFSWELMLADDLDLLKDAPQRFGRAAARSEDRFATDLYVDANGPDATFFAAGNNNIITSNPTLSTTAIQTGITTLMQQTDTDSEPIMFDAFSLVVPPALGITAAQIINTLEYRVVVGGNTQIVRGNGIGNNLRVVVNPYIPIIASSSNGNTSWFLFGNPSDGRPAATMAFLRGYEEPQVFIKEPNQRRIGGGVNFLDGDFDTDAIEYKVRHAFGGVLLEPKSAVASNGSGN